MCHLYGEGEVDILVTPEHRMFYRDDYGSWVIKKAINIVNNEKIVFRAVIDEVIMPKEGIKVATTNSIEQYKGKVYCFHVTNHLFITMRNNRRTIQGNTAFAQLEAFVNGPILDIQRNMRRELEAQWYDPLVREYEGINKVDTEMPVKVKHKWNAVNTSDFTELFRALSLAYDKGQGWLTRAKSWELAGLPDFEEEVTQQEELIPPTMPPNQISTTTNKTPVPRKAPTPTKTPIQKRKGPTLDDPTRV